MVEQVFLEDKRVKVTKTRLIIKNETYSMAGIISVKSSVIPGKKEKILTFKDKFKSIVICTIFFGGISKICSFFENWKLNLIGFGSIILLLFIIWTIVKIPSSKDIPPIYTITLRTASGEIKALENQDREFVEKVIRALNDAIVARG